MYKTTSRFMRGYRGGNVQIGRSKRKHEARKFEQTIPVSRSYSRLIKAGEREEELRLALERTVKSSPRAKKRAKQRARRARLRQQREGD